MRVRIIYKPDIFLGRRIFVNFHVFNSQKYKKGQSISGNPTPMRGTKGGTPGNSFNI
jgi:hypothetical protein